MRSTTSRLLWELPLLVVLLSGTTGSMQDLRAESEDADLESCEDVTLVDAGQSRGATLRRIHPSASRRAVLPLPGAERQPEQSAGSTAELFAGHRWPNGLNAPLRT